MTYYNERAIHFIPFLIYELNSDREIENKKLKVGQYTHVHLQTKTNK